MAESGLPGVDAARAAWLAAAARAGCATLLPAEIVAISDAVGRVTAERVCARWSVPADPVAAMDGIAVCSRDAAPDVADPRAPVVLPPGGFDLVDTGDLLPAGRDTVIMREHVRHRPDGTVEIPAAAAPGGHVRQVGEDVRAGALLLPAHHRLRPMDAALAASTGHTTLAVHRRPVVAIVPTGDEIRPIGSDLAAGEVLDTNSLLLAATLRETGCAVRPLPIQPDRPDRITAAVRDAARAADLVLILAGSSGGRDDHTAAVLRALGEVVVHGVAVKPGHPVALGILRGDRSVPVVGVPGYPVSTALTVELFVLPLLAGLQGRAPPRRPTLDARLGVDVAPSGVERYVLVTLREPERSAAPIAEPSHRGAGALSALVRADGLLHVAAGRQHHAGDPVTIGLLRDRDDPTLPGRSAVES
ncbi:MAG: molybdopterin molybdotransferase MoeA [Pseudonocardia sp.]